MSTGHVLMGLLSRGQQHGYDLKREHDDAFPTARPMAYGQVYAALDRLHRRGFVEPVAVQRALGPDRTVYELTDAGRAELVAWLARPEPPDEHIANPIATRVSLALLTGGRAAALDCLVTQREVHVARMRVLTQQLHEPGTTVSRSLATDHALAHLDADLRWIDAAMDRVEAIERELSR